jgi:hypothetical protein
MTEYPMPLADDPLTRMFAWWNQAYGRENGFTEDGLGQFFAPDAAMFINGQPRAEGLAAITARFRTVQATTDHVEILLPFQACFASADGSRIYTRHQVRAVVAGKPAGELVGGWAELADGRITRLDFLSIETD